VSAPDHDAGVRLWIVPTPIGNLGDISARALDALRSADFIAAEDTRHSGILLHHFGIAKPLLSFHEHNEASRTEQIIGRLQGGEIAALISDAGMPGVSDPGYRLVVACIRHDIPFSVLPGPSAVPVALVASGFATDRFRFGGFLPVKSGQREKALRQALESGETNVFFESPYRLLKSLECLETIAPLRPVFVARELTKRFEEYRRGLPAEVAAHFRKVNPKGEICLVIAPEDVTPPEETAQTSL